MIVRWGGCIGDIAEVSAEVAAEYVELGVCEYVTEKGIEVIGDAVIETAADVAAVEVAAKKTKKAK